MNERILRTAALELQAVDNDDIVKVAGIFARIKNWWRAFSSPVYKERVDQLKDQSVKLKYMLEVLGENIDSLQAAIKDSDVVLYEQSLSAVRDYSLELAKALVETNKDINEATKVIPEETKEIKENSPEIEWVTKEYKKDPKIIDQLRTQLPANLDVPIGKINQPITDFSWFKQFTPDNIFFTTVVRQNLLTAIVELLGRDMSIEEAKKIVSTNKTGIMQNIQSAILNNGFIYEYNDPRISEEISHRPVNQMYIRMGFYNVAIPNTSYTLDFPFANLTDQMASWRPTRRINFISAQNIKLSPLSGKEAPSKEQLEQAIPHTKAAERKEELIKLAGKKDDLIKKHPHLSKEIEEISKQILPKYLDWSVKQLVNKHSVLDIIPTVNAFNQRVGTLKIKDINQYKDLKDLENLIKGIELKPSKTQEKKLLKSNAKTIYEDDNVVIVRPDSKNACMSYGNNTKWCITMRDQPFYEQYAGSGVVFYFILRKKPLGDNFDKVAYVYQSTNFDKKEYRLMEIRNAVDELLSDTAVMHNVGNFKSIIEADLPTAPEPVIKKLKGGTATEKEFLEYWNAIKGEGSLFNILRIIDKKYLTLVQNELIQMFENGDVNNLLILLPQEYIIQNVEKLLNSKDIDVRFFTVLKLPPKYIIQNAEKLLNDESSSVREETVRILPQEYIIQNVDKLLNDEDYYIREETVKKLPQEYIIQNFEKLLNDEYSVVRSLTLDKLPQEYIVQNVDKLLNDEEEPYIRYEIIQKLPPEYIIQNADKLLNDKDSNIRQLVKSILRRNKIASLHKTAGQEVPRQSTPSSPEQLKQILLSIDDSFSPEAADLFIKHVQFENGSDFKSILNNNIGNLSANPNKYEGNYWRPPWFNPGPNASKRNLYEHEQMQQGKAPVAFRAYNSLAEGVKAYVDMVKKTFPTVDRALRSGNALAMAEAVKSSGYCPDCDPKIVARHFGVDPSKVTEQPIATKEEPTVDTKQMNDEYNELIQQLVACGPAEKLVKKAIYQSKLPITKTLLVINAESLPVKIRYAYVLSSTLRKEIDADVSIHQKGQNIELECDVYGSEKLVIQAVEGIADIITNVFKPKFAVGAKVYNGINSEYNVLDSETSETSFRKFAMMVI